MQQPRKCWLSRSTRKSSKALTSLYFKLHHFSPFFFHHIFFSTSSFPQHAWGTVQIATYISRATAMTPSQT